MEFEKSGSSSMIWLVLAYLFHLSSPVALSFITKISSYASNDGSLFCGDRIRE
jgi:dipeptide/tripeptide permease